MNTQVQTVLKFWFGPIDNDFNTTDRNALWWDGKAATDRQIAERFGNLVEQALNGQLEDWAATARGRLALILLLDQFTRNIYRGSARAFAGDRQAQQLCEAGIAQGHDRELTLIERMFFYMPLEHAEDIAAQEHCVQLHQAMIEAFPQHRDKLQNGLDFAIQHRDIIQRFGRFPHRNRVLDRPSTPDELDYINNGGTRFGQ